MYVYNLKESSTSRHHESSSHSPQFPQYSTIMAPKSLLTVLAVAQGAFAYPWVARAPGVDSSMLSRRSGHLPRDSANCPVNPNHVPAAPVTAQFPYNNAINGQKGNEKGGYLVPAPGDTAHEYRAPNPQTDIRGPCPGLNVYVDESAMLVVQD